MSWNAYDISVALFSVLPVFWRNKIASAVESTSWNPWKCHFWGSKFQNVPRCPSPQKPVPSVRVPKLPTIHYQSVLLENFLTALCLQFTCAFLMPDWLFPCSTEHISRSIFGDHRFLSFMANFGFFFFVVLRSLLNLLNLSWRDLL